MRKKVAKEDEGLKEREISRHRKAAALAWLKHGKKASASASASASGSGPKNEAIGKMPNPLVSHATRASRHQANALSIDYGESESIEASSGAETTIPMSMCANMAPFRTDSSYYGTLPYTHQASRFKAEALALHSSSSSSSSSSSMAMSTATASITTSPDKQQLISMTTGQSLALLSLLPHQQSQKCFKKSLIGAADAADTTPWDCGSSLYDSFELLSLSNQLGRCLTTVHATVTTSVNPSVASSYSKLLKSLASNPMQGPSAQPAYIPRSLYALPQFILPNYLTPTSRSAKKRSSLIHPLFSSANAASSPASLPAPPPSSSPPLHSQSSKSPPAAEDHAAHGKRTEGSGFRRVFNSLLKGLHIKEDPANQKPKRSNLSEELEKLPKNRPPGSRGALKYEDPASAMALNKSPNSYFSACSAEMGSNRSPTSSASSSASAMESRRSFSSSTAAAASSAGRRASSAYFRNEGFRTTSKPPKSVKWQQPGSS